jgi:hypothetical protein
MLFDINIQNPFYTWYKVRRYFKFPDMKFKFSICNKNSCDARVLYAHSTDVLYTAHNNQNKSVITYIRAPYVKIILFRKLQLVIDINKYWKYNKTAIDTTAIYWESILRFINSDESPRKACENIRNYYAESFPIFNTCLPIFEICLRKHYSELL